MKKIILAVASVLALGLVVGCKQQIEGSLNVTSTNFNKSLDPVTTTKTYVYSVSGTATQTTKYVTYQKAGKYNSEESTTTTVWTPTKDVSVTETTDPNNNSITYIITAYGDVTKTTERINKSSKDADPEKSKTVFDKVKQPNLGNVSQRIEITKIDNKFYIVNADGTRKVVEGVDFSAAEIDFSKFSDETSTESVSYTDAVYDYSWDKASATPTDYTSKTTTTTSGYTYDLKLTRK